MSSIQYENKSIDRLLLGMALPIMLKFLISELYSMVDTFFAGVYAGDGAIAAISLVFPMQRFLWATAILVGVGTSTRLSRRMGAKDLAGAQEAVSSGASLLLGVQLPIAILGFLFALEIMPIFGADGAMLSVGSDYLRYISLGSVFLSATIFLSYILLSFGNTKISMIAMGLGAITNVILDAFFMGQLGMGVKGAGLASMLSQILSAGYAVFAFARFAKEKEIRLAFRFRFALLPVLFMGGLSAFVIEIEDPIIITVLNKLLLSSAGESGVAILGVVIKLTMFLFIAVFGVVSAMQPLAAYFYGAKNREKLKELLQKTLLYSFLFTLGLWALFMVGADFFVGIFLTDPQNIQSAASALRIIVAAFPLVAVYYLEIFYNQAKGEVRRALFQSFLRQIFLLLPISLVLVKGLGLGAMGVWLAFPLTDILAASIAVIGLHRHGILQILLEGEGVARFKEILGFS